MNGLVEEIAFGVKGEGRLRQRKTGGQVADNHIRRAQRVIFVERLADPIGDATAGQDEDRLITGGRLPFDFGGETTETPVPSAHGARRDFNLRRFWLGRKKKQRS